MMKLSSLITTGIACLLALCFAALSAAYWISELSGQHDYIIAVAVIGSVCVSLMGPIAAYHLRSNWLLIIPALVFITCDCYQNAQGYETFKGFTVSADVAAAQTRLDAARADLAALPMPSATGEIRRASTWETLNTTLTERVESAKSDLKALKAPSTPLMLVFGVMGAIQAALAIYFACIGTGKKQSAPAKKARKKDPKRVAAGKKAAATRRAKQATPLKLVASNDH
jgi:hypothetical protein